MPENRLYPGREGEELVCTRVRSEDVGTDVNDRGLTDMEIKIIDIKCG